MVVFPVDVVGERSGDGHELGAWGYRQEPSPRYREREDLREKHASLAAEDAGRGVKVNETVKPARVD
jgi:hypothetical protein